MPRAERLSSRLDTLLEAVFVAPPDPFSLYWDIAAQIRPDQLAQAQKKIRKTLRQKGEIGAESAVLVACVLHLTGFPAHRILHFLSLYVPGGIRLSLFELAVSAIFLGEPPIPASLLYDLTQYTYLEKRLLVRKSLEISDVLKGSLSPDVLLYLYLLALRDDLSNENIQLIALIMKNCFPALEVRTRIGGASLEEYGEIARAWKNAEQRSRDLDISLGSGAERRGARAFNRNSASFFLDKYFSDEALAEMRTSAPALAARRVPPRSTSVRRATARTGSEEETVTASLRRETAAAGTKSQAAGANVSRPVKKTTAARPAERTNSKARGEPDAATAATVVRGGSGIRAATAATVVRSRGGVRAAERHTRAAHGESRMSSWPVLRAAPTALAAIVLAVLLVRMTAALGSTVVSPAPAPPALTSLPSPAAQQQPSPSVPVTRTYVVRPGDSLWKIFTSMRAQNADRKGWMDFLSKAQTLNSLGDPDQLQPGKVLTLSAQQ